MAYFEDYQPQALRANIVPKEGIYLCKISEMTQGTLEDGRRYVQVKCIINCEGKPIISIFLTEGNNFDGNLTAFYDTFGIERNNMSFESWKDKRGYLRILLQKKGEYTNMVPRYILNDEGYVERPRQNNSFNQPAPNYPEPSASNDDFGDISF